MSDAEWSSWQESFKGATGPLPDIRAKAKREAFLHRGAGVVFFSLVALMLVLALSPLGAPEPEVHFIGWTIIAFSLAMSVGYVLIQRGIGLDRIGSPREALAFLERRLVVEARAAQLIRWGYFPLFLVCGILFYRISAPHEGHRLERMIGYGWLLFVLALTFSAPWWVARWNRRHRQEIEGWRAWLDEHGL